MPKTTKSDKPAKSEGKKPVAQPKKASTAKVTKPEDSVKTEKPVKVEKPAKAVKPAETAKPAEKGKLSPLTVVIIVLGCVAVLAIVLLSCLLASGNLGSKTLPKMSINGEETSEWEKTGHSIKASEDITTTCTIANRNLDSDLRPMVGESANSSSTSAGKYGVYSSLECVAKVEGSYDEYKKGAELVLDTNEGDFKLTKQGNKFELTHTYRVFADLTGAPKSTPYKVTLLLKNNDGEVLSEYDLLIKVELSSEDKKFISEWKTKIDAKIAQKEQEEKAKAEKEAAERESALNNAITPDYTDLFRNWRNYKGKYIRITGRVVQTDSSNSFCRVATKIYRKSASTAAAAYRYSSDDVIYVAPCNPSTKLLEDDVISVVGEANGNYTYTTVMGGSIEIPRIKGMRFWLLDHID